MGSAISSRLAAWHPFGKEIRNYSFFDYQINEALHMSQAERDIMSSLMQQIQVELQKPHDNQQDAIIVGYIELMLNFCQRFYHRQFMTRKSANSDTLMKFDCLLKDYYEQNRQISLGIPTVQYCAEKLCMSPNYFGDLIKKTTGDTPANISANTSYNWPKTNSHKDLVLHRRLTT